jgi:hypothetical protein
MPIGLLQLTCGDLLLVLFLGSPNFQHYCQCSRIRHVRDSFISQNGLDYTLYTGVILFICKKWRDSSKSINTIVVGVFGKR